MKGIILSRGRRGLPRKLIEVIIVSDVWELMGRLINLLKEIWKKRNEMDDM